MRREFQVAEFHAEADVGLVDAQTKSVRRDHDARVVAHKRQLRRVTLGFAHFAVVHADFQAQDGQRAGQRLDNFLSTRLKGVPKSAVYRVLRTGQVRVNGKRAKPETRLEGGDQVRIPPMRVDEPGVPQAPSDSLRETLAERVIAEDNDFIVLDKPRGLAAHGGSGVSLGAIEALRAIRPHQEIELVHRLDRDTSGCLLLARNPKAHARFQQAFEAKTVVKHYYAVVDGVPEAKSGVIDLPLAKRSTAEAGWRMVVDTKKGKPAVTAWDVVAEQNGRALVRFIPETGRTHQIRVHCAAAASLSR